VVLALKRSEPVSILQTRSSAAFQLRETRPIVLKFDSARHITTSPDSRVPYAKCPSYYWFGTSTDNSRPISPANPVKEKHGWALILKNTSSPSAPPPEPPIETSGKLFGHDSAVETYSEALGEQSGQRKVGFPYRSRKHFPDAYLTTSASQTTYSGSNPAKYLRHSHHITWEYRVRLVRFCSSRALSTLQSILPAHVFLPMMLRMSTATLTCIVRETPLVTRLSHSLQPYAQRCITTSRPAYMRRNRSPWSTGLSQTADHFTIQVPRLLPAGHRSPVDW
jgi:hypothetical protein